MGRPVEIDRPLLRGRQIVGLCVRRVQIGACSDRARWYACLHRAARRVLTESIRGVPATSDERRRRRSVGLHETKAELSVVVADPSDRLVPEEDRVPRVRQLNAELLVELDGGVAVDVDVDLMDVLIGLERQCARLPDVVAVGDLRRFVRGFVVDGDGFGRRPRHLPHFERDDRCSRVAFVGSLEDGRRDLQADGRGPDHPGPDDRRAEGDRHEQAHYQRPALARRFPDRCRAVPHRLSPGIATAFIGTNLRGLKRLPAGGS